MIRIRRALLSVYDKTGIVSFAERLHEAGVEIISSGGTARTLREGGVPAIPVEELTGLPDLFGGRVKTLTPQIHGGLLLRRDRSEDLAQAEQHGIRPIDLLCVNLYPFADTVARAGDDAAQCIEMIDIGGPAMVRAAAKNHRHVVVVTNPERYEEIAARVRADGGIGEEEAARLGAEAFAYTGAYDAAIADYLTPVDAMPPHWVVGGSRRQTLRYGENPNQVAACYVGGGGFWPECRQLQGKELSYNNLGDLWSAWGSLREFESCASVVIKHGTPCGAALGETPREAFERARDGDALSAFGGIVLFNRPADAAAAQPLTEMFLEVVGAPGWSEDALAILKKKRRLRVLTLPATRTPEASRAVRGLGSALLVQTAMPPHTDTSAWRCVTEARADAEALAELDFAWRVVRHVKSNAIVFSRDRRTIGIGCGQTSRIDACECAVMKAERAGHELRGSVLASDAFFPFRDVVDRAAEVGTRWIVQPGGSRLDKESIEACNEHGIGMVFTDTRVFMH